MDLKGLKEIEFVSQGFDEILSCEGVTNLIEQHTARIVGAANENNTRGGDGFASKVSVAKLFGHPRIRGYITSTDRNSAIAEAEDKALSRAVR